MTTIAKYALGALVGITGIATLSGGSPSPETVIPIAEPVTKQITTTPVKTAPTPSTYKESVPSPYQDTTPLEPVRTYTNTYGNTVQSPTYYNSRPSGASAQCGDGTYSFSQSRRGTCSHHGGVAEWY